MAPNKRGSSNAAPGTPQSKTAKVAPPADAIELHQDSENVNTEHYIHLLKAHDSIVSSDAFENITTMEPLKLTTVGDEDPAVVGYMAPFNPGQFQNKMNSGAKLYISGSNGMWVNVKYSATPGMPLNYAGIKDLQLKHFPDLASTTQLVWLLQFLANTHQLTLPSGASC